MYKFYSLKIKCYFVCKNNLHASIYTSLNGQPTEFLKIQLDQNTEIFLLFELFL